MKKLAVENILDQKKPVTHFLILIFSIIVVSLYLYFSKDSKSWDDYLGGFLVLFIEIESFLFIASLIFSNLNPGTNPREITRKVLSRFAIFLLACLMTAFVIIMSYHYLREFITGGDLSKVMSDFFEYSFRGWFKSTLGGLATGTIIFIMVLWQDALLREQKLREENLIFQNETLKNQVNPHFLFNSLNTLSALVEAEPDRSGLFITKLASIYRYILDNSQKDKVPLKSELAFIRDYFDLHKIRDEEKIDLLINVPDDEMYMVLPVSLQILMENAIKHNMATRDRPLRISIFIENKHVIVRNNLQKMAVQRKSTRIGLKNLAERVRLSTGRPLVIEENANDFTVKVPLLS